jgi:hypothetical protein
MSEVPYDLDTINRFILHKQHLAGSMAPACLST